MKSQNKFKILDLHLYKSKMTANAQASYFIDNTDYTSPLDSIGSNKSIKEPLTIKDFTLQ